MPIPLWAPARALVPSLEAAIDGGGVHLVDVPIDYSDNVRVLGDGLSALVGKITVG